MFNFNNKVNLLILKKIFFILILIFSFIMAITINSLVLASESGPPLVRGSCDISVASPDIRLGSSVDLQWVFAHGFVSLASCSISPNAGMVLNPITNMFRDISRGSVSVSPTVDTDYTLSCGFLFPVCSDTVSVRVFGGGRSGGGGAGGIWGGCSVNLLASSPVIQSGESVVLSWSGNTIRANSCVFRNNPGDILASPGSKTVTPNVTTIYHLTCDAMIGPVCTSEIQITVAPRPIIITPTPTPTPTPALSAPIISCLAISPNQIHISWTNVAGETGYRLYFCSGDECSPSTQLGPVFGVNTLAYSDRDLRPGTSYSYRVRAFNAQGDGPWSNTVTCLTHGLPAPCVANIEIGDRSELRITQGLSVVLEWSATNAQNCSINQNIGSVSLVGDRVITAPNLATSTTYTITCDSIRSGDPRCTSNAILRTVAPMQCSALLTASPTQINSGESAILTWVNDEVVSCEINNNVPPVTSADSGSVSVSPTETTIYTLTCRGAQGDTCTSQATVTVGAVIAPVIRCSPVSSTQINLSWNSVTNATGYRVRHCSGAGCTPANETSLPANSTSFNHTGLNPNTIYRYELEALGLPAHLSRSAIIQCTTLAGPSACTVNIGANPNSVSPRGSAVLSWSGNNIGTCTIDNGVSIPPNATSVTVTPATSTTYTIRCNALTGGGITCSDRVRVQVASPAQGACVISFFRANPDSIRPGGPSTLQWDVQGERICRINGQFVSDLENMIVRPLHTTTYNLVCESEINRALICAQSVVLHVEPDLPTAVNACRLPPPPPNSFPLEDIGLSINPVSVLNANLDRSCLPFHPNNNNPLPRENSMRLSWAGWTINDCGSVIPGSSPSSEVIFCRNLTPNWSLSTTMGSGWIGNRSPGEGPYYPQLTSDYSMCCMRYPYTCSRSKSFASCTPPEAAAAAMEACEKDCSALRKDPRVAMCSCTMGCCNPRERLECVEWALPPLEPACIRREWIQYCEPEEYSVEQVAFTHSTTGTIRRYDQQVRVIQQPGTETNRLVTEPLRPSILLNQFVNLIWRVSEPDSSVPTTLRCTPSIARGGDGERWVGERDSALPTGTVRDLSPNRTTVYQLDCRNRDNLIPNQCYNDSDQARYEVRVFGPDLREIR